MTVNEGEVYRKQGDTWPPLYATLTDDTGAAIVLSGATVTWEQRAVEGGAWSAPVSVTIDNALTGQVHVDVNTTVLGDFIGHFVVVQSGKQYTIPDDSYIILHIME